VAAAGGAAHKRVRPVDILLGDDSDREMQGERLQSASESDGVSEWTPNWDPVTVSMPPNMESTVMRGEDGEGGSVNVLAQWRQGHFAALVEQEAGRVSQDAWCVSVEEIVVALSEVGRDCKLELTALEVVLSRHTEDHRSHLLSCRERLQRLERGGLLVGARAAVLERWLATRQKQRNMQLRVVVWAHYCHYCRLAKRLILLQRCFSSWGQEQRTHSKSHHLCERVVVLQRCFSTWRQVSIVEEAKREGGQRQVEFDNLSQKFSEGQRYTEVLHSKLDHLSRVLDVAERNRNAGKVELERLSTLNQELQEKHREQKEVNAHLMASLEKRLPPSKSPPKTKK
jgi:hypothetical protein